MYVTMDWNINKNGKYIIILFIFVMCIPHIMMSLCAPLKIEPREWIKDQIISPAYMFWLCAWVAIPVTIGIVSAKHVLNGGNFCPIFAIEVLMFMLTYGFQIEDKHILMLFPAVPFALLTECFSLLNFAEKSHPKSENGFLTRLALNRNFLTLLYFWSIVYPCAVGVAWSYHVIWSFPPACWLLPVPFVLMFLPYQQFSDENILLNKEGLVGILALWGISALLDSHLWEWGEIARGYIGVGYLLLFTVEGSLVLGHRIGMHFNRKNK